MPLVLKRKLDQSVFIYNGNDEIKITIKKIKTKQVEITIDAPSPYKILREELVIGSKSAWVE
tara:strand:- start:1475 stop:1660 length:186 start_codon:yes stop_codon:yes gene_type:complete